MLTGRFRIFIVVLLTLAFAAPADAARMRPRKAPKKSSALDLTLKPREFRKRVEEELAKGRRKIKLRQPKPVVVAAVLLDLQGAKVLQVERLGFKRKARMAAGESIRAGDRVTLPAGAAARVGFLNGAQILLSSGAVVLFPVVEAEDEEASALHPLVSHERGELRGLVKGDGIGEEEKFRVLTPSAVIAVTGTDFLLISSADRTTESTFTGQVMVAPTPEEMDERDFTEVEKARFMVVDRGGKKWPKPKKFDLGVYAKAYFDRNPVLRRMWKDAGQDYDAGTIQAVYEAAAKRAKTPPAPRIFSRDGKGPYFPGVTDPANK